MANQRALVIKLNDTTEYQPLLDGVPVTCGMRSGRVYLSAGSSCSPHTTGAHEEQLTFLSGSGEAVVEGETLAVSAGSICYIPPEHHHVIKNTGTEPLIYIYCVTPG